MMSIRTLAVFTAVGLETGEAKAYLENTSNAVKIIAQAPLGGIADNRSISMRSSGPRSHSGMWIN